MHTRIGRSSQRLHDFSAPVRRRRHPLWQEIAVALLLKLALLIGIKWLFFSQPLSKSDAAARLGTMIAGDSPAIQRPVPPAAPHDPESK